MKAILPFNNNVIVRKLQIKAVEGANPRTEKEAPLEGTVISIAAGRELALENDGRILLKAGDHVCFKSAAGDEVTIDGQSLLILSEADILAVLDEIETETTIEDTSVVKGPSPAGLSERFLSGVASILEFFPSPDRFDSWRLAEDTPIIAWPTTVRNEFAALQGVAKSEETA
jgi:chaperonin GroES